MTYRMLIVDDDYLVRMGLKETVEWEKNNITIVGEAENGKKGLEKALELMPDIIITDVKMPVMDGLELIKAVKAAGLDCAMIILSGYEEFQYVRTALHNGAFAYLLKPIDNEQLLSAVLSAAHHVQEDRSTKRYYGRLREELDVVKKQFLRDFLCGRITDYNKAKEKLDFYNLHISLQDSIIAYISVDDYDDIELAGEKKISAVSNECINLISELLTVGHEETGLFVELGNGCWVIMIEPDYERVTGAEKLTDLFTEAAAKFESRTDSTVSIGISGKIESADGIGEAYQAAERASQSKLLSGLNSVTLADEIDATGYKREIQQALKYISENYASDFSVEMVAKELYISSSYLMHLFKDELGKTFNECLTDYRISISKQLLKSGKYKIYEVSDMIGYKDVKYFSQIFKKSTGLTPTEYIKKALD